MSGDVAGPERRANLAALAWVVMAAVATLGGCHSGEVASYGYSPAALAEADQNLFGRWTDATGRELPDGMTASGGIGGTLVVVTTAGSTTCSENNTTIFLQLAWPVGTELDLTGGWKDAAAPTFVRDTTGSRMKTDGPSDLDVEPPKSARPTGFQREGNTISVDPKRMAVYVTRADGRAERRARLGPGEGCG
jgi:hypothetical protein